MYNYYNNWQQPPLQQYFNDYGYQGGAGVVQPEGGGGNGRGWEGQGEGHRQGYHK